jgi:hypothetical protein
VALVSGQEHNSAAVRLDAAWTVRPHLVGVNGSGRSPRELPITLALARDQTLTLPFYDRASCTNEPESAGESWRKPRIVALGRALGMGVVIEGVETEEQRVLLRRAGCNEIQGYLFAKPTTRDEIDRLVEGARAAPEAAPLRAGLRM